MTIELPPLEPEPLIYFLFHSGTFVSTLAGLFFFLGLVLGWACWGRHKRRARILAGELENDRAEIVDLKRKLTERTLWNDISREPHSPHAEPAAGPTVPVPAMPELALTPEVEPVSPQRSVRPIRMKTQTEVPARPPAQAPSAIAPFSFLVGGAAAEPGRDPADNNI